MNCAHFIRNSGLVAGTGAVIVQGSRAVSVNGNDTTNSDVDACQGRAASVIPASLFNPVDFRATCPMLQAGPKGERLSFDSANDPAATFADTETDLRSSRGAWVPLHTVGTGAGIDSRNGPFTRS